MSEAAENDVPAEKPEAIEPEATLPEVSGRRTITMMSLAVLAVLGAATANSLPESDRIALTKLDLPSLPKLNQLSASFAWPDVAWPNVAWPSVSLPDIAWPDVSLPKISLPNISLPNISLPNFGRVAAKPVPTTPPPPDPVIMAALTEIQVSQRQSATALAELTESTATQQTEMKKLSRQVTLLSVQMDSLRGTVTLTTSSIQPPSASIPLPATPPSSPLFTQDDPMTASIVPSLKAPPKTVRVSRKPAAPPPAAVEAPPPVPKPVGPVSVGGAPLVPAPAPATGSGA